MTNHENSTNPADEALENAELPTEETVEETADSGKAKKKNKGQKEGELIEQMEAEVSELKDKYLRLFAEFDNYKKRTVKEKLDLMRTAAQDTLASMLPVMDDFDRAKKTEQFSEGVELLYQKLASSLKNRGLNEMESTGTEFNPELHEAITEIPAPSEDMKGKVVDTIEKGYYLHDKIIRHAKVVVGR
jgi:molecular chaperone GrpE